MTSDDPNLYLYGIVDAHDRHDDQLGDHAQIVRSGALAAVCTDIDGATLRALTQDDGTALLRLAADHDAMLRRLSEAGPVLPVRLGTLFAGTTRLAELLRRSQQTLLGQLARVRGHGEWVVRVRATRAAEPVGARAAATATASGKDYLLARRDARRTAQHDRELQRARVTQLDDALAVGAAERRPRRVQRGELMLATTYLVPHTRAADLHRAVDIAELALRAVHCDVELEGPLPPYSFVDAQLGVPA